MSSKDALNYQLNQKTFLGLKLWVVIGISVFGLIMLVLIIFSIWFISRRKTGVILNRIPPTQIPDISKEITVDRVARNNLGSSLHECEGPITTNDNKINEKDSMVTLGNLAVSKSSEADNLSQCSSVFPDKAASSYSGDEGSSGTTQRPHSPNVGLVSASPLVGLPEFSHLGWGHWFTLRDLEYATSRFSRENVIGEGGYGVVYRGRLINGTEIAVKRLLNNMGQAEKEFRVEVEAIGHVRHKNLVRLLGYCVEGIHRMLVYEYVNNGNLEQWLHGAMRQHGVLSWESRMKVILGTAKALAYLHEGIEPKVVHRDIKSSNILIDDEFNSKVSDFGLAKLLGSGKSHLTTRVMGTFGYVAPEYANTGLLNEKSDVYSFGVLLLEAVTGRDPVDYGRPANEVNLVEWIKFMVGSRRSEEVVDPSLEVKPSSKALKLALLASLKCVDPDAQKRPKMGQVVRLLEAEDYPFREDRKNRRSQTAKEFSMRDASSSIDFDRKPEALSIMG
ncbi:probable receptor-like protein kinase At2g42960 [Phalaenopsis equestris]|uniref:probable receptor-like protein kinase At2g42960 n=1 Tax=Phalaenopsis equestris TaxID=78828 RepID=UPI0009E1A0FB|nr:probable receptor-like protein kinase At2g42960 [Phalaenopsis equestris]